MPRFSYRCPECMHVYEADRLISDRNAPYYCVRCAFGSSFGTDEDTHIPVCERIPDAPNFTVTGYSEKNGYSK